MSKRLEDSYELDVDLPGFKKDEVNVSELKDGYLTIQAAKGLDKDNSDKKGQLHPSGTLQPAHAAAASMWARLWSRRMSPLSSRTAF